MKYLLGFIFIYFSNQSCAITVEDILSQHGKNNVVSALNQQFQDRNNTELTINVHGIIKRMHRPAPEYITANTIRKDLERLGINVVQFNHLLIENAEIKKREKLRQIEERKRLKRQQIKKREELRLFGFEFDGWQSGITISEMKKIARKRQLPMSPENLMFIAKFNEKHLNSQPKQRNYTYRTQLIGKMARVTLSFTKNTKQLYQVRTVFNVMSDKQEERAYFYDGLYSQLTKKYGKPSHVEKEDVENIITRFILKPMIGSLLLWKPNNKNNITLNYKKRYDLMSLYKLTYINLPLVTTNKNEITSELQQRTDEELSNDGSKF